MTFLITFIHVIVAIASILLILLVVVQSNKGSDVGLFGGSSEMVFGSQQMGALAKITVILAIIVMGGVFLVGFLKVLTSRSTSFDDTESKGRVISQIDPETKGTETVTNTEKSEPSLKENTPAVEKTNEKVVDPASKNDTTTTSNNQ